MKLLSTVLKNTAFVVALMAALAMGSAQAAEPTAEEVLSELSEKMINSLKAERDVVRERPQRMFELMDEILGPYVDFPRVSALVLAKNWRKATKEQRQDFMDAFRVLLVRFYATALLDDPKQLDELLEKSDNLIVFLPPRGEIKKGRKKVFSEVNLPSGTVVPVNFSVHNRDGDWKIYDVNVEGISVVQNYRTSFAEEIKKDGIDGLIARLQERNEALSQKANGAAADTPAVAGG